MTTEGSAGFVVGTAPKHARRFGITNSALERYLAWVREGPAPVWTTAEEEEARNVLDEMLRRAWDAEAREEVLDMGRPAWVVELLSRPAFKARMFAVLRANNTPGAEAFPFAVITLVSEETREKCFAKNTWRRVNAATGAPPAPASTPRQVVAPPPRALPDVFPVHVTVAPSPSAEAAFILLWERPNGAHCTVEVPDAATLQRVAAEEHAAGVLTFQLFRRVEPADYGLGPFPLPAAKPGG